jgi:hypothetical protein
MKKYKVPFTVTISGEMEVEADNMEEAIETVESESLIGYCGNGGVDKLMGVDNDNISLQDSGNFEVDTHCIEDIDE